MKAYLFLKNNPKKILSDISKSIQYRALKLLSDIYNNFKKVKLILESQKCLFHKAFQY